MSNDPRANLIPFKKGDARAVEAGKKGAAAKRARRAAQAATSEAVARELDTLRTTLQRDDLGPTAAAAAQLLIGRVATGDIPVRNGDEAAALLRALVDVARIEEGQHTSASIVGHIDGTAAIERIRSLREAARAELQHHERPAIEAASAAAEAVADPVPVSDS